MADQQLPTEEQVDVTSFQQPEPNTAQAAIADFMQGSSPVAPEGEGGVNILAEDSLPDPQREVDKLTQSIDALSESNEMTYIDRIKRIGVSMDDAAKIVDDLLTRGQFIKTYKLTKTTDVTFKTRGFRDHERLQNRIEDDRPSYMGTVGMLMSRNNLAASLVQIGKRKFVGDDKGEPKTATEFIRDLPYPVFNLLLQKLSKFDELVMTVLDEGAVENF